MVHMAKYAEFLLDLLTSSSLLLRKAGSRQKTGGQMDIAKAVRVSLDKFRRVSRKGVEYWMARDL